MYYNQLENYLREIQSSGRYAVTLDKLKDKFNISEKAILQSIYRLKSRNQLAQVRKEFYVIIPPQYSHRGMVPPTLFINDMMDFLHRDYYVGLLSAAALHGAGHQQPMEFQVITEKPPLRKINNQKLKLNFFTKSEWNEEDIIEKKTDTGYIKVSTPELTAFDLVSYSKKIGGINRIIPILEDLIESIKPDRLKDTSKNQKNTTIQRLGYLFDQFGDKTLSNTLYQSIRNVRTHSILLSLSHKKNHSKLNKKWNIIINTYLDI